MTVERFEELKDMLGDEYEEFVKIIKSTDKKKSGLTEKGIAILDYMREHKEEYKNVFSASSIGKELGIGGRSVSGSMRKLIEEQYVVKYDTKNPVTYGLRELDN